MISIRHRIQSWPPAAKRASAIALDAALIPLSLWLALCIRVGQVVTDVDHVGILLVGLPFLSVPVFLRLGLYRSILRYADKVMFQRIVWCVLTSSGILLAMMLMVGLTGLPRSLFILYGLVLFTLISATRLIVRYYLHGSNRYAGVPVTIYGAGETGRQLANILASGREYMPVAFLDDSRALHGREIGGLKVLNPADRSIEQKLVAAGVEHIFLAMPATSRADRNRILKTLEPMPFHVRSIPSLNEILEGYASIDQIQEVEIEDLLGRNTVPPDNRLLTECVTDRKVLITGAGGSIGSELCRQLVGLNPDTLVLVDNSEYALFQIEAELREMIRERSLSLVLVPLLGDVCDVRRMTYIVKMCQVDTVYHAAAYKHVPIVERNPLEGVRNNVLGTAAMADIAEQHEVKHFVLISTDKAVRPTNVMGASKRLAELVLQAKAQRTDGTVFSMVRFGNVLGSSGSVVPLFREQIAKGGPLTVTHPDITRYFMTIREAVQLVIQAGAMAKGGDVFVLDMGEPVKIMDLAWQMIHLSGRDIRNEQNPHGDIEIQLTGLRPGEKLYEELLIGGNVTGTVHPKIMRAKEDALSALEINNVLRDLRRYLVEYNVPKVTGILCAVVGGYKPWVDFDAAGPAHSDVVPLPARSTQSQ